MTTAVIAYLPRGFVQSRKWDVALSITGLGYRAWLAILAGDCEPNARSLRERYDASDYAARKALASLENVGLLKRFRLSLGNNEWRHYAVVTDTPEDLMDYTPELRASNAGALGWVAAKIDAFVSRARRDAGLEPDDVIMPVVPAPVDKAVESPVDNSGEAARSEAVAPNFDGFSSVDSRQLSIKDPLDKEVKEETPGSPVDNYAAKMATRMASLFRAEPGIEGHLYVATQLVMADRFGVLERSNHAVTVALALLSGRQAADLDAFLHGGMSNARNAKSCVRWRLSLLRRTLQEEKRKDQEGNRWSR